MIAEIGGTREHLMDILKNLRIREISEKAIGAALLYQVVRALWETFVRYQETKSLVEALGAPRDVTFIQKSTSLLERFRKLGTVHEEAEKVREAQELIASRKYCVDQGEILQLKNKLRDAQLRCGKFLEDNCTRTPPFVIYLQGSPGAGKTTLINSFIDYFASRDGVPRKVADVCYYNLANPYPAETCKNDDARYLVMNDIPQDYSNYLDNKLTPLEVLLQMLIDSAPFAPPGASIEAKERFLNKVEYVIITSNFAEYKTATDPEKLVRRFAGNAMFNVAFAGNKKYDEIKHLSTCERNDITQFRPLLFNLGMKNEFVFGFSMDPRSPALNYPAMFQFVEKKLKAHEEVNAREDSLFRGDGSHCGCGIPVLFHLTKGRHVKIFPHCDVGEDVLVRGKP